jgi:hypothetical protein
LPRREREATGEAREEEEKKKKEDEHGGPAACSALYPGRHDKLSLISLTTLLSSYRID